MAHYRVISTHYLAGHLQCASPELRDIVMELRSIILTVAPTATERVHPKGFTYFDAERGGPVSAGICQIGVYRDHVRLAFIHGAFLPDPQGLLEGNRKAKRYIEIHSYGHAPWDYFRELIVASAQFDPYALQEQ